MYCIHVYKTKRKQHVYLPEDPAEIQNSIRLELGGRPSYYTITNTLKDASIFVVIVTRHNVAGIKEFIEEYGNGVDDRRIFYKDEIDGHA